MLHRDLVEAFGRMEAVHLRVEPLVAEEIDLVLADQLGMSRCRDSSVRSPARPAGTRSSRWSWSGRWIGTRPGRPG